MATSGCGNSGSSRAAVSGKVTVDGVPLENGAIGFTPIDGNTGPSAGAGVNGGVYSIDQSQGPAPGWNLIAISGGRKTGRKVPSAAHGGRLMDEIVPVVPEQFNARSTLKRELQPGRNILDFELTGK